MKNRWPLSLLLGLCLLGPTGCRSRPPSSRQPTPEEASAESVVVNYAPQRLRVMPMGPGDDHYLLLGTERPELVAKFRPLGVSERRAPPAVHTRAGDYAWVDGHLLEAMPPASPPRSQSQTTLLLYDRDIKQTTAQVVNLPTPCTQTAPALLQSRGALLYALVRCPAEDRAIGLELDSTGALRSARMIEGAGRAELFLYDGDAYFLAVGRQLLRAGPSGPPTIGTMPPPEGSAETRDLVIADELLLLVDGIAGRVIGMDRQQLSRRFEKLLPTQRSVTRLRAVVAGQRLLVVVAERQPTGGIELFGIGLPLEKEPATSDTTPVRLRLGGGVEASDHELVPIAASDGGGALLVRTHAGNTGPLVALQRLRM